MTPADRLIVALDVEKVEEASRLVKLLVPTGVTHFKVGLTLFTQAGPSAVETVHQNGGQVFLDLKFHDVPTTVGRAAQAAARLGVWMTDLHIQGGSRMMRQAVAALKDEAEKHRRKAPLLVGVTVLTSMAEKDLLDLGLRKTLKDQVLYLAKLAQSAGLDGIVASANEARVIRWACGNEFVIVTPGIRPADPSPHPLPTGERERVRGDDQQRIAAPAQAVQAGADYLVVGRPILEASDPVQAIQAILKKLS